MSERLETDEDIIAWLEQEYAKPFSGWDFSYIKNRRIPQGQLPWNYQDMVRPYLGSASSVLDMDTGGGEVLADLLSTTPHAGKVSAVEGYAPNVAVARETLAAFSVEVHDISKRPVHFDDDCFDLVIDRHGGSLVLAEIHRVLQHGGHYITEQVGDQTNREVRAFFRSERQEDDGIAHNANEAVRVLSEIGYKVVDVAEHCYPVRFIDVGTLVYYLKALPWEVTDFSVERYGPELVDLHRQSVRRGYAIDATYHAYQLVARKHQDHCTSVRKSYRAR